jgi:hypothetical protein
VLRAPAVARGSAIEWLGTGSAAAGTGKRRCSARCFARNCLAATVAVGWSAAAGAATVEFAVGFAASGFYGAITQRLQRMRPAWSGALTTAVLLPAMAHGPEFAIHRMRGTAHLRTRMTLSVGFTAVAALFNWFAMRRGALLVGDGERALSEDLVRFPSLLREFLLVPVRLGRQKH